MPLLGLFLKSLKGNCDDLLLERSLNGTFYNAAADKKGDGKSGRKRDTPSATLTGTTATVLSTAFFPH